MSGDVQPRKRKDKKRKKDDLGIEEPRGTAAVLGEGDVFMHSYHDHGTGGHWCAKIIFFSLLAVLVTLIGLIILENRGLSELEANAVKSQYSGVFEGWLEDAPDDDHHDEHTLELKHHDDDESDHGFHDDNELSHEDDNHEEDHEDDDVHDEHENDEEDNELDTSEEEGGVRAFFGRYFGSEKDDERIDENDEDDDENSLEDNEDEEEEENSSYEQYNESDDQNDENDDDDDERNELDDEENYEDDDEESEETNDLEENEDNQSNEDAYEREDEDDETKNYEEQDEDDLTNEDDNYGDSTEKFDNEETKENEEEDEHEEAEEEDDTEIEVERIEREVSEEEPISLELPALKEDGDNDDDDVKEEEEQDDNNENSKEDELDEDEEFLEADDEPPPVVERITAPAGKPLPEVDDDDTSSEKPPDTLEEEEEYEKRQEEKKREEAQASHMWLKLAVGGALLVATQAVLRRATAPRDEPESDEHETREETPIVDRRMTLIPVQASTHAKPTAPEPEPPVDVKRQIPSITKSAPTPKQTSLEDEEQEEIEEIEDGDEKEEVEKDKELYSEEEEVEEEEELEIEPPKEVKKEAPKQTAPVKPPTPTKTPTPELPKVQETKVEPDEEEEDEEVPDDVEIIEDEEEEEEDDDEEEISDVDDTELLSRLEAKYGRLPEPERPAGYKIPKDGGNSLENDDWPGEPIETYWRQQLNALEQDLRQGEWSRVVDKASAPELSGSARARFLLASALDKGAEEKRDNKLLSRAISAYLNLLKMNEHLSDKKLVQIANRTIDRMQFRGNYLNAEPVYRLLIRRFPDDVTYRNNLSVSFLMANRGDLAEQVLKETLEHWPDDPVALAHYAFVLKTEHNKLEEAVKLFQKALENDTGPACEPRFYYHLGDALLLLSRFEEAHEVHKRAAKHGHFLSPAQRSLYNVPRLKSQGWWNVDQTPYAKLARALEKSWKDILKEGQAAKALYEKEKEGLKERGEWSQLDLFVRGMEIPGRCKRAPVTCSIVRMEPAAIGCRRGQIKFSSMEPGTHVRPHVGPTNCRLRMHLGLSNTKDTYIRVDQETRQWHEGKVLMFDDSFEHEVWHNGTGTRLVLIVDVWHPDLTARERRSLSAI